MKSLKVDLYGGRSRTVDYDESPATFGGLVWRCAGRAQLDQKDTDLIITAIWNAIYEARRLAREQARKR